MIEVDHVSKYFGPIPGVRDVSFQVNQGEVLGFLGPNGAGKTTTMRVLTGFFPPTSGSARVMGLDVMEETLAVRRKIGYLPENVPLYHEMAVDDYLRFVAEIKGLDRSRRKKSVGEVMEICRLDGMDRRLVKKLSKGYRQRLGLAQALIGDPEVLILDEPTIGLDPRQIAEIRNLIKNFAGQKTVILSTHILPEVSMTCQRVVIIHEGRVVAEDTPENLSAQIAGADRVRLRVGGPPEEVRAKVAQVPGVREVRALEGQEGLLVEAEAGAEVRPQVAAAVCAAGWDLYELTPLTATLEDIFLKLVTSEEEAPGHA